MKKKKIDLETNLLLREKETKSKINDLFINIIIRDKDYKKGDITAFPIVKRVLNEFTDDDKMLINKGYTELETISEQFNTSEALVNKFLNKMGRDYIEKAKNILEKFIHTPFYILFKDKEPDDNYIGIIIKLCILKLVFHEYNNINYEIIFKKIHYFQKSENDLNKIENKKVRLFALLDTFKYLLTTEENDNFKYKLMNMEELPEKSPFIESEIKFRKIISELKDNSKLSFLYLQLNSGAGKDLFSSKSFYLIKLIPLISIKNHILNYDYSPFFYIYNPSNFNILAFVNPQTNLKSFNEFCLKIGNNKDDFTIHQSKLNTVKLLFLKFHEYSHSKFSANYNFELSPQIAFKQNLFKLYNDKALSKGIIEKRFNYKYKNYLSKFSLSNEEANKDDSEENDQNYLDIIYHYLEDVGDEIDQTINEENAGESGSAMEYYLSNNLYCVNGIVKYEGDLNKLLNVDLYIGESLLSLKRIIEKKLKNLYKKNPDLIKKITSYENFSCSYAQKRKIQKSPGEMLTHNDVGLLISI